MVSRLKHISRQDKKCEGTEKNLVKGRFSLHSPPFLQDLVDDVEACDGELVWAANRPDHVGDGAARLRCVHGALFEMVPHVFVAVVARGAREDDARVNVTGIGGLGVQSFIAPVVDLRFFAIVKSVNVLRFCRDQS